QQAAKTFQQQVTSLAEQLSVTENALASSQASLHSTKRAMEQAELEKEVMVDSVRRLEERLAEEKLQAEELVQGRVQAERRLQEANQLVSSARSEVQIAEDSSFRLKNLHDAAVLGGELAQRKLQEAEEGLEAAEKTRAEVTVRLLEEEAKREVLGTELDGVKSKLLDMDEEKGKRIQMQHELREVLDDQAVLKERVSTLKKGLEDSERNVRHCEEQAAAKVAEKSLIERDLVVARAHTTKLEAE
ncbi:unnamed protein product, partial [Choristocarpus tenellus]